ncbi:MAG: hypothetical protein JW881_14455 [Spirochaetales bacterium]|nr:hypothetical protein [Spirochaetales bacterium]
MKKREVIILFFSMFLMNCITDPPDLYDYKPPKNYEDGFVLGTLSEVAIEQKSIEKAVSLILVNNQNEVHSLLIVRDNKLVLEEYFKGHKYK